LALEGGWIEADSRPTFQSPHQKRPTNLNPGIASKQ